MLIPYEKELPRAGDPDLISPGAAEECHPVFARLGRRREDAARYWLTHETKTQLINLIDSSRSVETLVKAVEAVLTTGKLKDGSKITPNVLEALKAAWEGDYQ